MIPSQQITHCSSHYYRTTNHNQGTTLFLCKHTHTQKHTHPRTRTQSYSQIKGCGWVWCVASFPVYGADNGTVCGTHVPQQSTEKSFEETPSHGRRGLARDLSPPSPTVAPENLTHSPLSPLWGQTPGADTRSREDQLKNWTPSFFYSGHTL